MPAPVIHDQLLRWRCIGSATARDFSSSAGPATSLAAPTFGTACASTPATFTATATSTVTTSTLTASFATAAFATATFAHALLLDKPAEELTEPVVASASTRAFKETTCMAFIVNFVGRRFGKCLRYPAWNQRVLVEAVDGAKSMVAKSGC